MERNAKHFQKAILYAKENGIHLVFVLFAKPWAGRAARLAFVGVLENVAVLIVDWKKFGKLPVPHWRNGLLG